MKFVHVRKYTAFLGKPGDNILIGLGQSLDVHGSDIPFRGDIDTVVWTWVEGLVIRGRTHPIVMWPRFSVNTPQYSPGHPGLNPSEVAAAIVRILMPGMSNNCPQFRESFQHFRFRFVHVFADILCLR